MPASHDESNSNLRSEAGPPDPLTVQLRLAQEQAARAEAEAVAERFAGVLRAATELSIIGTDAAGIITVFNTGAERMLGYRAAEVIGKATPLLIHDQTEVASRAAELGTAPGFEVFVAAARQGEAETREWTYVRKDGARLTVSLAVTAMYDPRGSLSGFIGIARDITEQKQAEEERTRLLAQEQAARSRAEQLAAERAAILEQIADGVMIADPAGRITFVNEAALHLHGVADLEAIVAAESRPYQLLTLDGRPCPIEDFPLERAARHNDTVAKRALRIRRSDGTERVIEGSARPVAAEDGTRLGAVLTIHDVTAQHELERQKDEFIANVSHDVRTPVTAIKVSVGVILANEPPNTPEPIHHMLVNIDLAADQLNVLVGDLLDLARLRAGRLQLRRRRWDLRDVASRAARSIEPLAQARGQQLIVDLPKGPVRAHIDANYLERALLNLLTNAHKYGRPNGTVRLSVEQAGEAAILGVADDGPGISTTDQAHIFERFYRAETETTQRNRGSGLGLPIARGVIELHGGRIWVESTPGKGTTFWFTVPTHVQPGGRPAQAASRESS